ncbi:MAG: hypothetical protein ACOX6T_01175 [Myxococcales bacterium]
MVATLELAEAGARGLSRRGSDVYWNIADCTLSANWQFDCTAANSTVKRIGVVVRFFQGGRWYRVGVQSALYDPSNIGE